MMKKKGILAWALTAVMAVGAVPMTAMAEEGEAEKESRVTATKTAGEADAEGAYTITLTAKGGTKTTTGENSLPADIVLVLDSSGSMAEGVDFCGGVLEAQEGSCKEKYVCKECGCEYGKWHPETCTAVIHDRLFYAKAAASAFVEGFLTENSKIRVGLCDFSGKNHIEAELTTEKKDLLAWIADEDFNADHTDGTSYAAGLKKAGEMLADSENPKYIVLVSDGEPNRGDGRKEAQALIAKGVTILTVGIDVQGDMERYLKDISSKDKDGNAYYYESSANALTEILKNLRETISETIYAGTDAVLTDTINAEEFEYIEGSLTEDAAVEKNGDSITWRIGNLTQEEKTISFRVKPKAGKYGTLYTNTDVVLTYLDTEGKAQKLTREEIGHPFIEIPAPEIPEQYRKKITFKVVNGTWADGTTADKIVSVPLLDAQGQWSENGTGTLTAPTGMQANTGYGNGKWDTTPPTTVSGTAEETYTYSFSKTSSGGGGGGGGSHSNRNTAKTEPKQEEVLNKEDHFQYVQGYPDGTVRPDANITRAEATVIFFRLLTDAVRENYLDTENSFTDVNHADWYCLGISTMENGGFVNGYEDGSFRPNGYITRAELATIISNFDDLSPVEESKFPDAAGHWAEAYINSAAEKGWLSGYADGLFRPNQLITRAETMSMINRVLNRSVDADGLHKDAKQWQDNPVDKWYYYAVLEATNPHEYERNADTEHWTTVTAEKIWEN